MIPRLLTYLYRHRRLLLVLTIAVTASILLLTLLPSDKLTKTDFPQFDKIAHIIVFGGWTYLFGLVRFSYTRTPTSFWSIDLLAGIGFGLSIELLQHFLPINRSADFYDFLADLLGILIAIYFLKQTHQQLEDNLELDFKDV